MRDVAIDLNPRAPLWAWALHAVSDRLEGVFTHLEGVRLGEDIEAVHDMRVGSRRLVAAMTVFAAAFPGHEYQRLFREARQVTRRLGAVRDLDVLLDYFTRLQASADPGEQAGLAYLRALLHREWKVARVPMLAALRRLEKTDLTGRLHRFLREESDAYRVGVLPVPRLLPGPFSPQDSFRRVAPRALAQRYHQFYAFEPYAEYPEEAEQLHEMRIAAKWLRYTMELFSPAYRNELRKPLAVVKGFQELLGELHDSDVRLDLLRNSLAHPLRARGLEAAGLLVPQPVESALSCLLERETRVRARCYRTFRREWRKQARSGFAQECADRIRKADA